MKSFSIPNESFLISAPLPEAESLLARALQANDLDIGHLGMLAATLFTHDRFSLAAMVFAKWTALHPDNPEPWSNLGLCMSMTGRLQEARDLLEHAISLSPGYAPAYNNLCSVYQYLGKHDRQLETALTAASLQPQSPLAANNLGSALLDSGRPEEARQAFETALQMAPDNFESGFNLARVALDEGRPEDALAFLVSALHSTHARSSRHRDMIAYHLSFAYLATGRLAEGWPLYESGFSAAISPTIARHPQRQFSVPRWDGEPLGPGKRLLLWREQGIGDELRFLSVLPQVEIGQAQLLIETEPRLVEMLRRAFTRAEVRVQAAGTGGADDIDFHLPIGSLPGLVMQDSGVFGKLGGYLSAMPDQIGRFRTLLDHTAGRPRVGICWRSHMQGGARQKKYTALRDWSPVLTNPGLDFVCLQYGDCEAELLAVENELGVRIHRWPDVDLKNDLEAVLGLMHHLDVVISPSTAVIPLAGALGRPTIFIGHPSWIMLGERERYPWFSSVRPVLAAPDKPVSSVLPQLPSVLLEILGWSGQSR